MAVAAAASASASASAMVVVVVVVPKPPLSTIYHSVSTPPFNSDSTVSASFQLPTDCAIVRIADVK